jgi:hypothetical protein
MSLMRRITRGLLGLFRQGIQNEEIAAEIGHYFEEAVAAGMARGLTRDEAQRAARAEIGNLADGRTRSARGFRTCVTQRGSYAATADLPP